MNQIQYYCACNGKLCEGICKEKHLTKHSKSNPKGLCFSAYKKKPKEARV